MAAIAAAVTAQGPPPDRATSRRESPPRTALWRDAPANPALVRVDSIPGVGEPSDLLLRPDGLYTVGDSSREIYRLVFDGPNGAPRRAASWRPKGVPVESDLEALAELPGGEVLLANETDGAIFVLSPFPERACAAWLTEIDSRCFIGRSNCGLEAMTVLPGGRIFVAKERDPRGAWLFDLPEHPCVGGPLQGRTYLTLPDEVGPDLSAATWDPHSGHLFVVARSRQQVLEFDLPAATPGDRTPRPLRLLGSFGYAATEDALDYAGLDFHQVEGIALDPSGILYLVVDNNGRFSRSFGNARGALLRFFPVAGQEEAR